MLTELRAGGVDARVASGGGRMYITMDRYEADWAMVQRGWAAHVLGEAEHNFTKRVHLHCVSCCSECSYSPRRSAPSRL